MSRSRTRGTQPKPGGRCWYCDGSGLSSEHIFAKSLTKLFDTPDIDRDEFPVRHDYQPPAGAAPAPKRAKTFAYTTRKFCRTCNSGWMNVVDDDARPTLAAFARGEPLVLSGADQEALALWATKTALGFLSKEPEDYRFASRELYRQLYESRRPLEGSQLWVGANNHGHMAWAGGYSMTFGAPLERASGFGASLSFGYGVVHLIHHGSSEWLLRLQNEPHRLLKPIWPSGDDVQWPPAARFSARDLEPLSYEINANSRWVPADGRAGGALP
jgi:hypothetical protein